MACLHVPGACHRRFCGVALQAPPRGAPVVPPWCMVFVLPGNSMPCCSRGRTWPVHPQPSSTPRRAARPPGLRVVVELHRAPHHAPRALRLCHLLLVDGPVCSVTEGTGPELRHRRPGRASEASNIGKTLPNFRRVCLHAPGWGDVGGVHFVTFCMGIPGGQFISPCRA